MLYSGIDGKLHRDCRASGEPLFYLKIAIEYSDRVVQLAYSTLFDG